MFLPYRLNWFWQINAYSEFDSSCTFLTIWCRGLHGIKQFVCKCLALLFFTFYTNFSPNILRIRMCQHASGNLQYDVLSIILRGSTAQTTWRCALWRCCSQRVARAACCWGWWESGAAPRVTWLTTSKLWATLRPCSAWSPQVPSIDLCFLCFFALTVFCQYNSQYSNIRTWHWKHGSISQWVWDCVNSKWESLNVQPCRSSFSPSLLLSCLATTCASAATLWANLQYSTSGSRPRMRWAMTNPINTQNLSQNWCEQKHKP